MALIKDILVVFKISDILRFPVLKGFSPFHLRKMAAAVDNTWFDEQMRFLLHNSETLHNTQCQIFNHNNTFSKYIQTTVLMPGAARKTRIYVHRLSYIVHTRNFDIFNRHMHVSHLCHNTHCINIQHLSYEPQHVNNNRQRCKIRQPKTCLGHGAYPDCVF